MTREGGTSTRAERRTSAGAIGRSDVEAILRLIGDDVWLLLPSWSEDERLTGGDIDCAVRCGDPRWPLRLGRGTRLLQCLEYDIGSRYWILEHEGTVFAIDALEDPRGLGHYSFPTSLLFDEPSPLPSAGVRAAYLTIKRIAKGNRDPEDWARIDSLARVDEGFAEVLTGLLGDLAGRRLARAVLDGGVPDEETVRAAKRAIAARRARFPHVLVPLLQIGRAVRRLRRPTGLVVVIAGPDGSGKSTLARSLPDACAGMFRRDARFHWRPGVLPGPGSIVGSAPGDPASPHQRPPHGKVLSAARLLYFWADFAIGSWTRFFATKARTGLVVVERGWWDMLVDPARYRLDVPPALTRALGRLLPQPDLLVVCEAPVDVLLDRKAELPREELGRQSRAWRALGSSSDRATFVDTSGAAPTSSERVARVIADRLERRALRRLEPGWRDLPRTGGRWTLPRGPGAISRGSLRVYQPTSPARRVAWEAARAGAGWGALRALPRGDAPAPELIGRLKPLLPPRGSVALARANHPGRFVALILGASGEPTAVAKLATDRAGREALALEARMLEELGRHLPAPLRAPAVVERGDGMLALRAEPWRARWRPWRMDEEVAAALGGFFAAGRREGDEGIPTGYAHGDVAPWNLLLTDPGWVLVDWEHASRERPVFYDVFHHLVQTHALLRRPSRGELVHGVDGSGPVAGVLRAYAAAANVDLALARPALEAYTSLSAAHLDPNRADGRLGIDARAKLQRSLEGAIG